MPIYEYDCEGCGKPFEQLVRSSDESRRVECPECGSRKVERRPSVFAAHAAAATGAKTLPNAGCGRCGDPNGPCAID